MRTRMRGAPAKNPVSVCGRGLPPPIDPEIHPNRPRKQETKYERNNLAARSVLTWYSSSQYPNYAVDFRPCRTSTPVPVTYYRSYPPALHSLVLLLSLLPPLLLCVVLLPVLLVKLRPTAQSVAYPGLCPPAPPQALAPSPAALVLRAPPARHTPHPPAVREPRAWFEVIGIF